MQKIFSIILALIQSILLLFGAAKLPALAKSMGQSARVFKGEIKAMKDDDDAKTATTTGTSASVEAPASEVRTDAGGKPDSNS